MIRHRIFGGVFFYRLSYSVLYKPDKLAGIDKCRQLLYNITVDDNIMKGQ